jgi:glycine cleavage system H protein
MDEFSRRLLGSPSSLLLPEVGTQLKQGDRGWTVMVDGRAIPMFTPVEGEVVEVNELALESPETALQRPYDDGWLLKVKVNPERCPLKNLLSGEVALAWLRRSEERVRAIPMGELGVALPDGGEPVDGFVRAMSPEGWDELAREMLWSDLC